MKKNTLIEFIKRQIIIEKKITERDFVRTVNDEWDIEVLDTMIEIIQNRKDLLMKMYNAGNPRVIVRGFDYKNKRK